MAARSSRSRPALGIALLRRTRPDPARTSQERRPRALRRQERRPVAGRALHARACARRSSSAWRCRTRSRGARARRRSCPSTSPRSTSPPGGGGLRGAGALAPPDTRRADAGGFRRGLRGWRAVDRHRRSDAVAHASSDMQLWLGRGIDCGRIAINLSVLRLLGAGPRRRDPRAARARRHAPFPASRSRSRRRCCSARPAASLATLQRLHDARRQDLARRFRHRLRLADPPQALPGRRAQDRPQLRRDLETRSGRCRDRLGGVSLATSLELKVVAEGVETAGQVEMLQAGGCHYGQGYLFAKPMAASRVPWFLSQAIGGPEPDPRRI